VTGAKRTILVDISATTSWLVILRQCALSLGMELDITGINGIESVQWSDYTLVVIGPSMASRSTSIIALIRRSNRGAKVLVFSTRPDWLEARDALLAGAVGYARLPEDSLSLSTKLEAALDRAPYTSPIQDMEPAS
jgi:hypothetical protein